MVVIAHRTEWSQRVNLGRTDSLHDSDPDGPQNAVQQR
jgi:hypothetical protein